MLLGAPDVLGQHGTIHKGVAVALDFIDPLVALYLLGTHGIGTVPLHEHLHRPGGERLVAVVLVQLTAAGPMIHRILVAGDHIEIDTGKVALELVVGLKHCGCVAVVGAGTQLASHRHAQLVVGVGNAIGTHAIRVIAAALVHIGIGGNNHGQVGEHGIDLAAKPTLGEGVLAVQALTHIGGCAGVGRIVIVLASGIHVNVVAVAATIGRGIVVPQGVVAQQAVIEDDALEGSHQCFVFHSDGISVIAVRDVGQGC